MRLYKIKDACDEIIDSENLMLINAYFEGLFPHLPEVNRRLFFEESYIDILNKKDKQTSSRAVFDILGFNDDTAFKYLSKAIFYSGVQSFFVDEAISSIDKSVNHIFAGACRTGNLSLLEKIVETHGVPSIKFSTDGKSGYVDGEIFNFFYEHFTFTTGRAFKRVVDLIAKSGLEKLLDLECAGFYSMFSPGISYEQNINVLKFDSSELPVLSAGILKNPELAIAFDQADSQPLLEKIYQRIPCWVDEKMLSSLPTAMAYNPYQALCYEKNHLVSYSDVTPDTLSGDRLQFARSAKPIMQLQPLDTPCLSDPVADNALLESILDNTTAMGFVRKSVKVLCVVDRADLLQFPLTDTNPLQIDKMQEFAGDFLPTKYFSAIYGKYPESRNIENDIGLSGREYTGAANFLDKVSGNIDVLSQVSRKFGKDVIVEWVSTQWCSPATIVNLQRTLGYDNRDMPICIRDEKFLDYLFDHGFRFDDGSSASGYGVLNATHQSVTFPYDCKADDYRKMCLMGLWPAERQTMPDSIGEALKIAIRRNDNDLYVGYLKAKGAEAVAQSCKTPAQWDFLLSTFPGAELEPALHLIPKKLRRAQLESDFGL